MPGRRRGIAEQHPTVGCAVAPPLLSLPGGLMELGLSFGAVRKVADMPKETIVYANHPVMYDTQNTLGDLDGTGVTCPPISSYLPVLIDYMKRNPEKGWLAERHH